MLRLVLLLQKRQRRWGGGGVEGPSLHSTQCKWVRASLFCAREAAQSVQTASECATFQSGAWQQSSTAATKHCTCRPARPSLSMQRPDLLGSEAQDKGLNSDRYVRAHCIGWHARDARVLRCCGWTASCLHLPAACERFWFAALTVRTRPRDGSRASISKLAQRAEGLTKNMSKALTSQPGRDCLCGQERASERERENISSPMKEWYPQRWGRKIRDPAPQPQKRAGYDVHYNAQSDRHQTNQRRNTYERSLRRAEGAALRLTTLTGGEKKKRSSFVIMRLVPLGDVCRASLNQWHFHPGCEAQRESMTSHGRPPHYLHQ